MKSTQFHYPSFISFLFFSTCALFLFLIACLLGLSTLMTSVHEAQMDATTTILFVSFGFIGSILTTAAIVSIMKFMNNPAAETQSSITSSGWKMVLGVLAAGLVLSIGYFIQSNAAINWLALPILTIPAVALPILLLIQLGTNKLYLGSRWRTWSTFGLSISFTPFLLFILEFIVIIFIFILFIFYVTANPSLSGEMQKLSSQLMLMEPNAEEILKLIVPFLEKPGVFIAVILFFSVIIPLLEEAFKPLALWIIVGKLESQAQGFALGALCGAGFALVETLNNGAQTDEWTNILFARIGTGAMHITTSALIGATIYSAWHERRRLRLLATYLLGVFLHGLWNFLAITNGFSTVLAQYGGSDRYASIKTFSMIGLVILTLTLITLLIISNRKQPRERETDMPDTNLPAESNTDI